MKIRTWLTISRPAAIKQVQQIGVSPVRRQTVTQFRWKRRTLLNGCHLIQEVGTAVSGLSGLNAIEMERNPLKSDTRSAVIGEFAAVMWEHVTPAFKIQIWAKLLKSCAEWSAARKLVVPFLVHAMSELVRTTRPNSYNGAKHRVKWKIPDFYSYLLI